jgi:hypothetical protein
MRRIGAGGYQFVGTRRASSWPTDNSWKQFKESCFRDYCADRLNSLWKNGGVPTPIELAFREFSMGLQEGPIPE